MQGQWASQVIAVLCAAKQRGDPFDAAWDRALERFPPRGTGMRGNGGEESMPACLRRYCDDAWHGRQPVLRHLSEDLLQIPEREGGVRRALDRVA